MQNVELKARLHDRAKVEAACRALGAELQGDLHQTDTYFRVPEGRLKLREQTPGEDYLVYYRRADEAAARLSDYTIEYVGPETKKHLAGGLGVVTVVEKTRRLYLWHNVRIHLDCVTGLGEFIEFEAVLSGEHGAEDGHEKVKRLCEATGVAPGDIECVSYVDLLLSKAGN